MSTRTIESLATAALGGVFGVLVAAAYMAIPGCGPRLATPDPDPPPAARSPDPTPPPVADPGVTFVTDDMIGDLVDSTGKHKGKTLQVPVVLSIQPREGRLPQLAGGPVHFHRLHTGKVPGIRLVIDVPRNLPDLPNADTYEPLDVTFVCGEGRLDRGNTAVRITRAAR